MIKANNVMSFQRYWGVSDLNRVVSRCHPQGFHYAGGPNVRRKNTVRPMLRRIRFKDAKTDKTLVFLPNQTQLPALTICTLYKSRWQVELFFKWISLHFITDFVGHDFRENDHSASTFWKRRQFREDNGI